LAGKVLVKFTLASIPLGSVINTSFLISSSKIALNLNFSPEATLQGIEGVIL